MSSFLNKDTKDFYGVRYSYDADVYDLYCQYLAGSCVDQELFTWGVFGDYIYKYIGTKLSMREIFRITDMNMIGSLFTTLMIAVALFKHQNIAPEMSAAAWIPA